MGLTNWIVQRTLEGEAKRLAKECRKLYDKTKRAMPNASEQSIIINMFGKEEDLPKLSPESQRRIRTCCKSVNGLCYMLALDVGKFEGWMNLRSLQFTAYMDKHLLKEGFPKQSLKVKKEILEAMGLAIDGWEEITNDY